MKEHPLLTKASLAMLCITALAITALVMGINGAIFFAAVTAVAGLGGFTVGKATKPK